MFGYFLIIILSFSITSLIFILFLVGLIILFFIYLIDSRVCLQSISYFYTLLLITSNQILTYFYISLRSSSKLIILNFKDFLILIYYNLNILIKTLSFVNQTIHSYSHYYLFQVYILMYLFETNIVILQLLSIFLFTLALVDTFLLSYYCFSNYYFQSLNYLFVSINLYVGKLTITVISFLTHLIFYFFNFMGAIFFVLHLNFYIQSYVEVVYLESAYLEKIVISNNWTLNNFFID